MSNKTQIKKTLPSKKRRGPKTPNPRKTQPKTASEYLAQSAEIRDRWNRTIQVISKMRSEGIALKKAARDAGISARTVVRLSGSTIQKQPNGRYAAKSSDRLLRVLRVPTEDGVREVGVRGSRSAKQLAKYWEAVHQYLATGDATRLNKFRNKSFLTDAGSNTAFLTSLDILDRLGSAGLFSFESLYVGSN